MAFSSSDLSAIEAAILALSAGESVAQVTFANGHMIRYRETDLDRLIKLRSLIQVETGTTHRRVYAHNGRHSSE